MRPKHKPVWPGRAAAVAREAVLALRGTSWPPSARRTLAEVLAFTIPLAIAPGVSALAGPAEGAYHRGDLDRARKLYEERLRKEPGDLRARYNLGNVLYRSQQLRDAEEAYQSTLGTQDPSLRARAAYNLGNARLQAGEIDGAIRAYVEALRAEPGNADSKYNLELALRMREMKPPEQQPQDRQDQHQGKEEEERQQPAGQQDRQEQEQQRQPEKQPDEEKQDRPSPQDERENAGEEQVTNEQREDAGASQPPPLPGDYSQEEAERVLDGLAQEERDLLADRWRTLGQNIRVEKDW